MAANKSTKNTGTSRKKGSTRGGAGSSSAKKAPASPQTTRAKRGVIDNIWGVIFIAVGVFLFAAVQFHAAGEFGNQLGDILKGVFGLIGVIFPFYLILFGFLLLANKTVSISGFSVFLGVLILLMLCLINSGRFIDPAEFNIDLKGFYESGVKLESGGFIGMLIGMPLVKYTGKVGLYGIAVAVIFVCLLLIINTPISRGIQNIKDRRAARADEAEYQRRQELERYQEEARQRELEKARELKNARQIAKERAKQDKILQEQMKVEESLLKPAPTPSFLNAPKEASVRSMPQEPAPAPAPTTPTINVTITQAPDPNRDKPRKFGFTSLFGGSSEPEVKVVTPDDTPKPDEKTKKLIDLMQDESLFDARKAAGRDIERVSIDGGSFGLEEQRVEKLGYGLGGGLEGEEALPHSDAPGTAFEDPFDVTERPAKKRVEVSPFEPEPGIAAPPLTPLSGLNNRSVNEELSLTSETTRTAGETHEPADPARANAEKISNKEAREATLNKSDFSKVKKLKKYKKPGFDLLNRPTGNGHSAESDRELQQRARLLEETLQSFGVDARVMRVTQGPAVTRYEIQPAAGVKVSKIVGLSNDIALNLRAKSLRIEAPIPGKAAVGIEIQNDKVNMVTFREIVESREFREAKSKISFAVGRDIAGKAIVADLKGMPHLLIAGSTGSGKSVCINSIITSLLYKADPDEVKLVLIDPKVVELSNYNGIPHLLIPVVTEPTKAAAALNWAVAEMTDRYKKFADTAVRDLASYNSHMIAQGKPDEVMPQIVIIIDELADLMMAAPSQVEESICRLAQLARAAGMHLIVATQRPSVDIITGLIKANIPSRIAFAVASQFDSRTILDMGGAEKLVGKGDMLFNPLGQGTPLRVQGCFLSDDEVQRVIDFVKNQVEDPEYADDVLETIEGGSVQKSGGGADETDELLQDAIECVVNAGQASTSMLQRRFRIGYNRAARIVDEMEARGIVGPQDGSRARQVLLTEEEYEQMKAGLDEQ